ncbi:Acetyl-CoA carboxylase 2 [Raphanus sativus]|nr:Acetyl-CoA carboxylase 2 [Raphanus sativus]
MLSSHHYCFSSKTWRRDESFGLVFCCWNYRASDWIRLSNVSPWITSPRCASGTVDRGFPATVKLGSSSIIRAFKGVSVYKDETRRNVLSQSDSLYLLCLKSISSVRLLVEKGRSIAFWFATDGVAGVKFIHSVRALYYQTFGSEKSISLVANGHGDSQRHAKHIRIADQFMEVPGAKGVIFLGPTAASMVALGDKIGPSLIAKAADVPTLPWSGSHLGNDPRGDLQYRQACVYTTEEAVTNSQAMIKASWGGGGKGIRKAHNDEEVRALFKQVQGEVPGSPIFVMKVASQIEGEGRRKAIEEKQHFN